MLTSGFTALWTSGSSFGGARQMGAGSRPLCQEGRPPGRTHVRREGHQEGHMNHLGDSKGSKEVTSVTTMTTKTTKKDCRQHFLHIRAPDGWLLLQAYYTGEKDSSTLVNIPFPNLEKLAHIQHSLPFQNVLEISQYTVGFRHTNKKA